MKKSKNLPDPLFSEADGGRRTEREETMGMWNILTGKNNFMKGIEQFQNTPGAVLLDVRTREEYNGRHVPGSVNLPLSELEQISYAKTTPLFVYCHSGARSSQACRYLKQKGYQAENIGGIVSYRGAFG